MLVWDDWKAVSGSENPAVEFLVIEGFLHNLLREQAIAHKDVFSGVSINVRPRAIVATRDFPPGDLKLVPNCLKV